MITVDIHSLWHSKLPGVFLNNIILDKQSDSYSLSVKFDTKLVTKLSRPIGHYFNGDFNRQYKIALFYSNKSLASLNLSSIHQTRFSSLFTMAQTEEDVFLLSTLNLNDAFRIPERKNKGSFLQRYKHYRLNGGAVVFDLPFRFSDTIPMSNNLSLFVVPYLSSATNIPNSGVGNSIYEKPYYIGSAIGEDLIINGQINPKRTYFFHRTTRKEIANELIRNYDELQPFQIKRVVPFRELQEISVINDMNSKLITSQDTYTSDTSVNKNYFSRLTLSRDKDERVRGIFGVDILSLVRDNFPQSSILNSSSLQVVRRFINNIKVQIHHPVERIARTKRITSRIAARKVSVAIPGQETLEQNLRLRPPFLEHYSFLVLDPRRTIHNEYEYNMRISIDVSNIYKRVHADTYKIQQLRQKMTSALAGYDFKNSSDDKFSQIFSNNVINTILNYFRMYSLEMISPQEMQDYQRRLLNLTYTKQGSQKIIDFLNDLYKTVAQITSSLKRGSANKDPLSTGGFPSNHNAGSINHSFVIEHTFKETFSAKDNPRGYGTEYITHVLQRQNQSNPMLSVYPADLYDGRIRMEEEKLLLLSPEFAADVSSMTNEVYNQSLDLSLQRLSFLSPHSIKTGLTVSSEPLMADKITSLSPSDYNKYDYYLLKYLTWAAVQNEKLSFRDGYYTPIFTGIGLDNPLFIAKHLLRYFSLTKNTEVLNLYEQITKQKEESKNSFDTDDTSSSKTPNTNEALTDNIEEVNPNDILLSILSTEIMNNRMPFDPVGLYHLPQLTKNASYNQFSSLPNQIKAMIKYYDYVAEKFISSYQPEQEAALGAHARDRIINRLVEEDQISTSGYIYTNFLNLKEVQIFQGYELTDKNEVLMNKPIYSKLQSYDQLPSGNGLTLCKLVDYKNLKFNIPETGYFPTYNEHFFIKGNVPTPTTTSPTTTAPPTTPSPATPPPAPNPATGGTTY